MRTLILAAALAVLAAPAAAADCADCHNAIHPRVHASSVDLLRWRRAGVPRAYFLAHIAAESPVAAAFA